MSEEKMCSRPGCRKGLRKDNTKGVCSKNCQSPEAPANQRAEGVGAPRARPEPTTALVPAGAGEAVERFRLVAGALGMDPDQLLGQFAEAWLASLRNRIEQD